MIVPRRPDARSPGPRESNEFSPTGGSCRRAALDAGTARRQNVMGARPIPSALRRCGAGGIGLSFQMSTASSDLRPLVGREDELRLLTSLLDGVEGAGGALVLRGEPGV